MSYRAITAFKVGDGQPYQIDVLVYKKDSEELEIIQTRSDRLNRVDLADVKLEAK